MRQMLSPSRVFESADLTITGSCRWGEPIPSTNPGVYVVSLHPNPEDGSGVARAPFDSDALEEWLRQCPGLTLRGRRVDAAELADHLAKWWLPNTSILYIGKAEGQSLRRRVGQYYDTSPGSPASPWWRVLAEDACCFARRPGPLCGGPQ